MSFEFIKTNYVLPKPNEPGSFGFVRKFDIHTGIDIYCDDGTPVYSIENGIVVAIEKFTGEHADSPWWNDTWAVLVESNNHVIVYGEIIPHYNIKLNKKISINDEIGSVKRVLKKDKGITPTSMLHFEMHKLHTKQTSWWYLDSPKPESLIDPTEFLCQLYTQPKNTVK